MNRGRSTQFAVLLSVTFVAAMAWAGWDTMKRSSSMTPRAMSAVAYDTAAPSTSARLVMEVSTVSAGGRFGGRLLEELGGRYRLTSVPVEAQLAPGSSVVMGGAADIKPRAVLQLAGRFDESHRIRVARAVVLTGYVTVER